MSQVANLTNSRKLFNLSGWAGSENHPSEITYDLGYLLRKLPVKSIVTRIGVNYLAYIEGYEETFHASTPEDAACLLAIKLFEGKILAKRSKK